jgi:hypothetical protein
MSRQTARKAAKEGLGRVAGDALRRYAMFRRMVVHVSALAFSLSVADAMAVRAQQHQQHQEHHARVEVGNKGEVSFNVETEVGGMMLKPGSYQFQHRVENGEHFVRFTELSKSPVGTRPKDVAGEVKCAIEPADEEFSRTAIYSTVEGGTNRVTRIEVKGENVVHVF